MNRIPKAIGAALVWGAFAGCATTQSADPVRPQPPSPEPSPQSPVQQAEALAPLSAEQQEIAIELRHHLARLGEIGQRNVAHPLELADATDWVASELEGYGFVVRRQGFSVGDEVVQNLIVHIPGLRRGDHSVVIGARLDSPDGAGGADDNGSGAAALLCLAKRFIGKRALRSIDFVWFADGASRSRVDSLGAKAFLNGVQADKQTVTAMIELHGIGVFSDAPGSQAPLPDQPQADSTAQFIALSTYPQHAAVSDHFFAAFSRAATLPVARFVHLSDGADDSGQSAHLAFLAAGYPAMLVHDTHARRYEAWGTQADSAERLDFERMARVVTALQEGIFSVAAHGTNPARAADDRPSAAADSASPEPRESAGGAPSEPARQTPTAPNQGGSSDSGE